MITHKSNFRRRALTAIVSGGSFLLLNIIAAFAQSDSLPGPKLVFKGKQTMTNINGQEHILYRRDVENKTDYPKELFEAAPDLPPCGQNANSSRTWISIYNQDGRYLYEFCAVKSPEELGKLSFYVSKGEVLDYVYIVFNDRKKNKELRSNMISTTEP